MAKKIACPIRPETLRPFSLNWQQPVPDEIAAVLSLIQTRWGRDTRPTSAEIGALVGLAGGPGSGKGSRTFRRWMSNTDPTPIPYSAWAILCYEAGLGAIWSAVGAGMYE